MALTEQQEKEVLESIKVLKEENEALKKKVNGQESLTQTQKQEFGDARKKIDDFFNEFKGKVADFDNFKKEVDSIKSKLDNSSGSQGSTGSAGNSDAGADLRTKMTPAQKAKADEVFKKLKPEDRKKISSDVSVRNEFLKTAIEAVETSVPESLFGDTSTGEQPEDKYGFKRLFGLASKEKNFVPGGRDAGVNGFSGADSVGQSQKPTSKRLLGGRIPRPILQVQPTKE